MPRERWKNSRGCSRESRNKASNLELVRAFKEEHSGLHFDDTISSDEPYGRERTRMKVATKEEKGLARVVIQILGKETQKLSGQLFTTALNITGDGSIITTKGGGATIKEGCPSQQPARALQTNL